VVRLEELPGPPPASEPPAEPASDDRFEIGMAFDLEWVQGEQELTDFLERARAGSPS
jgi:hypothetical protein